MVQILTTCDLEQCTNKILKTLQSSEFSIFFVFRLGKTKKRDR